MEIMPAYIELDAGTDNQERIDYLRMILDKDSKRLELIDSQRDKNLAHALIIFTAAFGAALKFLHDANPYLISASLFFIAVVFFLRDCQLHRYAHGWRGTMKEHLGKLAFVINNPRSKVDFCQYYRAEERRAFRLREWLSFNRWLYYLLMVGALGAGFILANGWME